MSMTNHCEPPRILAVRLLELCGQVSPTPLIDKNRTGACGLGRNRRLLRHTELVFLSTVCARRVLLVLFTNMDATIVVNRAGAAS